MYRRLRVEKIIETGEILNKRIAERFPGSGLEKVSREIMQIAREAQEKSEWITKPLWGLRVAVGVIIVIMFLSAVMTFMKVTMPAGPLSLSEFLQVSEATINEIVLIGAAVVFLVTVETRVKRNRVLDLIHGLRALAHVVDMHQLTKDPETLLPPYQMTASSPKRVMSAFQLQRYLDYCSELLSIIGKVAAVYVQSFNDSVTVGAVNEIESLTDGLSRKVWQKIMVLQQYNRENLNPGA